MKVRILEFNGLPGCGKSTLANRLISELRSNGKIVLSENDIFVRNSPINKFLELLCALIDTRFIRFNYYLLRIGVNSSLKNRKFKNIKSALKLVRYNYMLNKKTNDEDIDVICLSEGIIQFIYCIYDSTVLSETGHLNYILRDISEIYKNILVINCNISEEDAMVRIGARDSKPNSIDLMDEEKRYSFIRCRHENMSVIRQIININIRALEIDTTDNIDRIFANLLPYIQ